MARPSAFRSPSSFVRGGLCESQVNGKSICLDCDRERENPISTLALLEHSTAKGAYGDFNGDARARATIQAISGRLP